MTTLKSKGTSLEQEIANVFAPVAQLISMDKDDMATETYESDTLDNALADIPYEPTGRTEPGSLSGELFLDPAIHDDLTDLLVTPAKTNWQLVFSNNTAWPFVGAGFSLAGPKVALKDGVKASIKIKLAGLPDFDYGSAS
jgi:hypothetical protein